MKIAYSLLLMILPLSVFADETFEINKKNCNLPIKEIRKRISDKQQQKQIFESCVKKANIEHWTRNKLVKKH